MDKRQRVGLVRDRIRDDQIAARASLGLLVAPAYGSVVTLTSKVRHPKRTMGKCPERPRRGCATMHA